MWQEKCNKLFHQTIEMERYEIRVDFFKTMMLTLGMIKIYKIFWVTGKS